MKLHRSAILLLLPLFLFGCRSPSDADIAMYEGVSLINSGDCEAAKERFQDALQKYETIEGIDGRTGKLLALMNLGAVYSTESNYREALNYTERALKLYRDWQGERPVQVSLAGATILSNAGSIHNSIGYYETAYQTNKEALDIFSEMSDSIKWKPQGIDTLVQINHTRYRVHYNLGVSYRKMSDYPTSIKYLQEALADSKALAGSKMKDSALSQIAITYLESGELAEQSNFLDQVSNPATHGLVDLRNKNYNGAVAKLSEALQKVQAKDEKECLDEKERLFAIHTGLGLAYEGVRDYKTAGQHLNNAIGIAEEIRANLPTTLNDRFMSSSTYGFTRKEPFEALDRIRNLARP